MECPYCHGEMKKGKIYVDRGPLKWIAESKDKGTFFSSLEKGIKVKNVDEYNKVESYYCKSCKKMIIDMK